MMDLVHLSQSKQRCFSWKKPRNRWMSSLLARNVLLLGSTLVLRYTVNQWVRLLGSSTDVAIPAEASIRALISIPSLFVFADCLDTFGLLATFRFVFFPADAFA